MLCSLLRDRGHNITSMDVAGNDFNLDHIEQILLSLSSNKSLTSIDLRNNPGFFQGLVLNIY